ncbi:hypothetical protein EJ08DRAFT_698815 [Tothia fuscella]|uniref:Uncharacterized protein n=1 Tax=Tothia fuscella TaxID=1048955 RepID=A0A9P4TXN5_9PEZI|nr:hypothetical protein EJ08DRAFT_698815 [Tothia fuscella]
MADSHQDSASPRSLSQPTTPTKPTPPLAFTDLITPENQKSNSAEDPVDLTNAKSQSPDLPTVDELPHPYSSAHRKINSGGRARHTTLDIKKDKVKKDMEATPKKKVVAKKQTKADKAAAALTDVTEGADVEMPSKEDDPSSRTKAVQAHEKTVCLNDKRTTPAKSTAAKKTTTKAPATPVKVIAKVTEKKAAEKKPAAKKPAEKKVAEKKVGAKPRAKKVAKEPPPPSKLLSEDEVKLARFSDLLAQFIDAANAIQDEFGGMPDQMEIIADRFNKNHLIAVVNRTNGVISKASNSEDDESPTSAKEKVTPVVMLGPPKYRIEGGIAILADGTDGLQLTDEDAFKILEELVYAPVGPISKTIPDPSSAGQPGPNASGAPATPKDNLTAEQSGNLSDSTPPNDNITLTQAQWVIAKDALSMAHYMNDFTHPTPSMYDAARVAFIRQTGWAPPPDMMVAAKNKVHEFRNDNGKHCSTLFTKEWLTTRRLAYEQGEGAVWKDEAVAKVKNDVVESIEGLGGDTAVVVAGNGKKEGADERPHDEITAATTAFHGPSKKADTPQMPTDSSVNIVQEAMARKNRTTAPPEAGAPMRKASSSKATSAPPAVIFNNSSTANTGLKTQPEVVLDMNMTDDEFRPRKRSRTDDAGATPKRRKRSDTIVLPDRMPRHNGNSLIQTDSAGFETDFTENSMVTIDIPDHLAPNPSPAKARNPFKDDLAARPSFFAPRGNAEPSPAPSSTSSKGLRETASDILNSGLVPAKRPASVDKFKPALNLPKPKNNRFGRMKKANVRHDEEEKWHGRG